MAKKITPERILGAYMADILTTDCVDEALRIYETTLDLTDLDVKLDFLTTQLKRRGRLTRSMIPKTHEESDIDANGYYSIARKDYEERLKFGD